MRTLIGEDLRVNKLAKWDQRFLSLAKEIAGWSKDPSTQTGAVIVRPDRTIASVGFNGFARGMNDDSELYADRDVKYERIIHCEMNAKVNSRECLQGYTLYTWPILSCPRCAVHMIQAGIKRCVAPVCPEHLKERWEKLLERAMSYFDEALIEVRLYDS